MSKTTDHLIYQGKTYRISEWITLSGYVQTYGGSLQTLASRIDRGSVPAEYVLEIPEWNLKLIKNQALPAPARGRRPRQEPG